MVTMQVLNGLSLLFCLVGLASCGHSQSSPTPDNTVPTASPTDTATGSTTQTSNSAQTVPPDANAPLVATTPSTPPIESNSDPVAPKSDTVVPASVTTESFIFQNSQGICDALKNWDPKATTIVFPTASAGKYLYTFAESGVTISHSDGSQEAILGMDSVITIIEKGPLNNPPVCTISVENGQLVNID